MRLLICAGGTGGGVYPALSVLAALKGGDEDGGRAHGERRTMQGQEAASSFVSPPVSVLWVGGDEGMEVDLVNRAGLLYQPIPAAGVHGVGLRTLPRNLVQVGRGVLGAREIIRQFRPDVLFFTGGYVAVPVALAARLPGTARPRPRIVLYVPDIEPGLALKTLARFADQVAVTVKESRAFFSPRTPVAVTGYPVRQDLSGWTHEAARKALDLSPDLPTVLVSGGSKGCRSINRALLAALPQLLAEMQVVHVSGNLDWPEVQAAQERLTAEQAARYRPYPYLHAEMGAALRAADLVLSRAGASTLGEYPLFGLPAILVPYPYAWRYQRVNARYLEERGAAVVVEDEEVAARLYPVIRELMEDHSRRKAMGSAMKSLACPEAAKSIADLLTGPVSGQVEGGSQT